MIVSSWNVNSVRTRLGILVEWLETLKPDIVLLQEIKCTNEQFPYEEIESLNYNCIVRGQKSYNGVAILSKHRPDETIYDLEDFSEEARYVEATFTVNNKQVRVASIYVPNGREVGSESFKYKLKFFDALLERASELLKYEELLILGGDYNVAPEGIDVYDINKLYGKIGFHIEERKQIRKLFYVGLYDAFRALNTNIQEFSWWDYRGMGFKKNHGMRIDNMLLSAEGIDSLKACKIEKHLRSLKQPSDHVPVTCYF